MNPRATTAPSEGGVCRRKPSPQSKVKEVPLNAKP